MNLVEANVGGDVFETIGAKVAEQADFAFAVFRLAHGDEVHPSVVVVVEGGDAPRLLPSTFRKIDPLKFLALAVSPERYAFCIPIMRKCDIHPAVVIKVKNCGTSYYSCDAAGPRLSNAKLPFSGVF